jgi:hypothetical protein
MLCIYHVPFHPTHTNTFGPFYGLFCGLDACFILSYNSSISDLAAQGVQPAMDQMHQASQEPIRRRDAGAIQVTERDILVLTWTAEQFCLAFDQLQRLLGRYAKAATKSPNVLSISATRDAIGRWLQLGFVEEPRKILTGHPPYLWLSRRGLAQLGLPYAYYKPQVSRMKHIYAVNAIRLHLETFDIQSVWYPERALTREIQQRPLPDAELRAAGMPHAAVKVIERPFAHDVTLRDELAASIDPARRYTSLWYFVHVDALPTMQQALTTLDQDVQRRVTFYGLDARPATGVQTPLDSDRPNVPPQRDSRT